MENPYFDMDESIEEYSPEESSGKLRWILDKGLTIGKKMLVTGLVISSAPVVIPPLVVISFIGFACSVPYGILLASYGCTNKVMSKLLPGLKPPPFLLEYGKVLFSDEEVENGETKLVENSNEIVEDNGYEEDVGEYGNEKVEVRGEEMGLKGDIDMENEEEEMLEDTREMVEMRIELVHRGNDEVDEGHICVRKDVQESAKDSNEIVEENEYEEDVGEYNDENEVEPMKLEVGVIIEGVGEEEEQEPAAEEIRDQLTVDEVQAIVVHIEGDEKIGGTAEGILAPFEVTNIDVELCQNTEIKEDEELVKETRGLLEKFKEEGMTDRTKMEGNQKVKGNVEEVRMPFEDRIGNARMEEPLGEVEKNSDEIPKEKSRVKDTEYVQTTDVIPKERSSEEMVGGSLEKKDITSNIPEAEKPTVRMNEATKVGNNRKEEQKPGLNKPSVGAKDNVASKAKENNRVNREKENVISSIADAREIADKSGFDLFDKKDAASHESHQFYADKDTVEGHKRNEAGISSHEGSGIASSKSLIQQLKVRSLKDRTCSYPLMTWFWAQALWSEEKIWEQIDAMRRIVGYKAAPKATSIEELKALYLFTGVEPPTIFKDPSDLVEVDHKLKFLMSVVGVK